MNKLKHIEINIGKACNNKCRFCMSSKPELWDINFVDTKILEKKLTSYFNNGYRSVGFLGGDISIHPNFKDIIVCCKSLGYELIQVITNGMKFDDYEFTLDIISSGVTRVNVSIHSHNSEIEKYLTQVSGSLERKLMAIDNFNLLLKKGILKSPISINIVLNRHNLPSILEFVLYFSQIKNIKDIRINFVWLSKDVVENRDDLKISYTEFLPYLKNLIYISIKYKLRITFDTVPACIFYKIDTKNYKTIVKKFLGEDLDHINEIDHINGDDNFNWKDRKKDELKTQFEDCGKCIYRESCQGVWKEYGDIYLGDEFVPIIR